jgi:hypothetical protein
MRLKVLRISLWTVRTLLAVLAFFWLVMLSSLLRAYVDDGSQGIRDYLTYVGRSDGTYFPAELKDPILAIHSIYQSLIFYLLLAWFLRELHGWLRKHVERLNSKPA